MYVATGNRGLGRRLAGAHRLSGLRGLRGLRGVRGRLGKLGQDDSTDWGTAAFPDDTPPAYNAPISMPSVIASPTSNGLSPSEINLITQGISTAGALGVKALTPTPTVTYNPATGQYSATGGATLPASLTSGLGSLTAYLPILLLGGGLLVVVSMMKK
jgi:hypothetical protein